MGRALALCLARAFEAEGMTSEALDVLRVARKNNPRYAALTVAEAEMHIRAGDVDRAATSLASITARADQGLGQQEVRSRMLLGEALLTLGRHDDAERVGRELIAQRPAFGGGWLVLADALLARGKVEDLWALHAKLGGVRGAAAAQALIAAAVRAHTGTRSEAIDAADAAMREHPRDRMLPQLRERLQRSPDNHLPTPLIACLTPPWIPRARTAGPL
jgi:predicted Zn-dependent protease